MTEFIMMGSDHTVRAMNHLMQHFFHDASGGQQATKAIDLWGRLQLAIRKDLGNKATTLGPVDMLKSTITDIDTIYTRAGELRPADPKHQHYPNERMVAWRS